MFQLRLGVCGRNCTEFSVHFIKKHFISVCDLSADFSFDPGMKRSTGFLPGGVTSFLLVVKNIVGRGMSQAASSARDAKGATGLLPPMPAHLLIQAPAFA